MKPQLKYIELKSGYAGNGPAWISLVEFSKSGKTVYFNGRALKGNGHGACIDLVSNELYWISGIKKNGHDRHWTGKGKIMIDREAVDEYMQLVGLNVLDPDKYELVAIQVTDKKKFTEIENRELDKSDDTEKQES
jgi:hypothetical protein